MKRCASFVANGMLKELHCIHYVKNVLTSDGSPPMLQPEALVGPQGLVIAFIHLWLVELPSQVLDVDKAM